MLTEQNDIEKAVGRESSVLFWTRRGVFLVWSIIVLILFFERFVMVKLQQFISWIK